jgi:hypothetical protein
MHRVVMKAALLRVQKKQFSESDSWEGIKHWVSLSPEIGAHVEWALKAGYEVVAVDPPSNSDSPVAGLFVTWRGRRPLKRSIWLLN